MFGRRGGSFGYFRSLQENIADVIVIFIGFYFYLLSLFCFVKDGRFVILISILNFL